MNPIRVLIVDDHTIVAQGLERLLGRNQHLRVIGHARTMIEARRFVVELAPDLILLDLHLPDSHPSQTVAAVRRVAKAARIIVLTAFPESGAGRAQGVDAYLDKQTASDVLLDAILRLFPTTVDPADVGPSLTAREMEVVRLAMQGLTNKEIAQRLFLSPNTVKSHLAHALHKLGFQTRIDLARNWDTIAEERVRNHASP